MITSLPSIEGVGVHRGCVVSGQLSDLSVEFFKLTVGTFLDLYSQALRALGERIMFALPMSKVVTIVCIFERRFGLLTKKVLTFLHFHTRQDKMKIIY